MVASILFGEHSRSPVVVCRGIEVRPPVASVCRIAHLVDARLQLPRDLEADLRRGDLYQAGRLG